MDGKHSGLVLLVLASNVAIVAGAVAFEWHAFTVVALLVADGLLGLVRISLERAFARRPPADGYAQLTGPRQLVLWYENLLGKRGSIRITERLPPITVRHLPYTIMQGVGLVAVGTLITVGYGFAADTSVNPTLATVLPLFVAKHTSIIAVWANTGVYEKASPLTVRHFSVLYSHLLIIVAILFIAPQPSNTAATVAAFVLVPKLLFDFREAGIGPWPLTFDPTSDTSSENAYSPIGIPRHVFQTDDRALLERAYLYIGLPYIINPGLIPFVLIAAIIQQLLAIPLGTAAFFAILAFSFVLTAVLMLEVSRLIVWLGHGNVEYRVYDDELEAYDRYLDEPQWVVPLDDIRSISTEQQTIWAAQILPVSTSELTTVELECATSEDRRVEFLAQPDEFVRIVRESARGQAASI